MQSPALSPRQFEWTLLAYAATLLPFAFWLPLWFSGMLLGVLLARWLQRRRYAQAWPGWIKFPLLAAILLAIVVEFGNPAARQAGTALLLGLGTLKLIESERRRDSLLLATVCLFLISVQFLFDQSIGVTVYMLAPLFLVFFALNEVTAPPGTRGGLTDEIWRVGRELGALLAIALPLTIFLFLSVPRLGAPLWGTRDNDYVAKTGLSDSMSPGNIAELLGDDTPVMRVSFEGPPPPRSALYWRGPVLWQFDGETWSTSRQLRSPTTAYGRARLSDGPPDIRYQAIMEPTERRWLTALDLAIDFPQDSAQLIDGQVVRAEAIRSNYAFRASAALNAPVPILTAPTLQARTGLQLPPERNPKTLALARQWRDALGGDRMAIVERAMQHIRFEGYSYTLTPLPLVGAHRVDEFLFETREGFCEHYAAAFVVLMRAAGVPARVVTGYLGGYYNRSGDYLLIRNSDAHAWAEVLIDDQGWVRVDPTAAIAPDRIEQEVSAGGAGDLFPDSEWMRNWRERVDNLRAWWNETVVRFDALRQREFFSDLGIDPSDWRQLGAWMGAGLGGTALIAGLVFFLRRRPGTEDAALRSYQRYLKAWARQGCASAPSEGARSFAARLADRYPESADATRAVALAYEAARYADGGTNAQAALDAAIARCLKPPPRT